MLKVLCYVEDKGEFEYIAAAESGRLATRTQNPFAQISEIQDLERHMQAKLDAADNSEPESLAELVEQIKQYNEPVSAYERVRYVKSLTQPLVHGINVAKVQCDNRFGARAQQNLNTVLNMDLKVIKVERDGE